MHFLKSPNRIKWFRKYKDGKNHPAQFRRERLFDRWIRALSFI